MAVVAGLFDSQADADLVMNEVLRMNIDGLESRVYNGGGQTNTGDIRPAMVFPVVPNTGAGTGTTMGNNMGMGGGAVVPGNVDWFDDLEEVERAFYLEGMKEGATLAVIRVPDDYVEHVRLAMRKANARTYVND